MKTSDESLKKIYENMSARDYNLTIRFVNDETPRKEAAKVLSKEQMAIYDSLLPKLKQERKKHPKVAYGPVESEW